MYLSAKKANDLSKCGRHVYSRYLNQTKRVCYTKILKTERDWENSVMKKRKGRYKRLGKKHRKNTRPVTVTHNYMNIWGSEAAVIIQGVILALSDFCHDHVLLLFFLSLKSIFGKMKFPLRFYREGRLPRLISISPSVVFLTGKE